MSGSQFDPRVLAQYLSPGAAERLQALGGPYASLLGGVPASASLAPVGPPAPGTPYAGPKPYVAGAYNTLAPTDFAAYQASLQPAGPGGVTAPQPLPGLLDDANTQRQIEQAKKLFDNPNGYWSGGEGSGGNGGGQR